MPLESCMILLDCSEYMRNGDYLPTRAAAQQDAANLLVQQKTQSHPESTVGAQAGTELLVSPTDDIGKILNALHDLQQAGVNNTGNNNNNSNSNASTDVCSAVAVASLALKHRSNKNGIQQIVLFVGSPVTADVRALQKTGKSLKKNNVILQVVAMGELEANEAKLQELVNAANGRVVEGAEQERTCHLVTIPVGVLPSDVLASSPIMAVGGYGGGAGGGGGDFGAAEAGGAAAAAGAGGGAGAGFADYGGVDPNMDPELAMALRVSMEEERARQERVTAAAAAEGGGAGGEAKEEDAEMPDAAAAAPAATAATAADMGLSEEEALLQQALAMSMNENEPKAEDAAGGDTKPAAMDTEEDEDAAMQMALQMSMAGEGGAPAEGQQFQDPAFVNELLGSMPGVDPNDPEIQEALRQAKKKKEDEEGKKEE